MYAQPNVTVLVVDDELDHSELTKALLIEAGYSVVTASSAEIALQLQETYQPFLIITDFSMPDMNGAEFIRQLRTKGHTQVPVIMLSSHTTDYLRQSMLPGFSFNLLLSKPVDFELLLAMVHSYHKQHLESLGHRVPHAA